MSKRLRFGGVGSTPTAFHVCVSQSRISDRSLELMANNDVVETKGHVIGDTRTSVREPYPR